MSQIKPQLVTCPDCGLCEERTLFASLNGERVPAQVPHLLDDTFEEQRCSQCGLCVRPEHGPHELTFRGFAPDRPDLQLAVHRLGDGAMLDELVMPRGYLEEVAAERATAEANYPELFSRPYISATRYL